METRRIDPELIKACYKHWNTAKTLMEEIYSEINELCKESGLVLVGSEDMFTPLYSYDEDFSLKFFAFKKNPTIHFEIIVDKDGNIIVEEKK